MLIGVSSSISAYRALDVASVLRKCGAEVRAVMTDDAAKLVSPKAFDAITHQRTIVSLWGGEHAGEMDHLAVTKWADVFAIIPATGNTLASMAHGLAADALGTFVLAWNKSPLLIAPAMNPEMWRNAATQANVRILEERGHRLIGPCEGRMACDDVGKGRLAPVEELCQAIADALSSAPQSLKRKQILITAGPTREFADDVRCITNPSTGRQGFALAEEARSRGAKVTLVLGPTPLAPPAVEKLIPVVSADEMLAAVLEELPACDAAIFSAAVSDWKPAERHGGKEKKASVSHETVLKLMRTPDIAEAANRHRKPGQIFVGFAAESENLEGYAGEKMQRKGFSLVFANPINEAGAGFGAATNRGLILRVDGGKKEIPMADKRAIARIILDELKEYTQT